MSVNSARTLKNQQTPVGFFNFPLTRRFKAHQRLKTVD